ncbi:MAG: hypothetical protein EA409_12565 [Saprospirales bacterium]|nr:MAG: hypothetical protein EA409_12565 [Saprospirales bacterium]
MAIKDRKVGKKINIWLLVWGGLTIISYTAPLADPGKVPFAVALLLAYPFMLLINLSLGVFFLVRSKYLSALFALLLIIAGWPLHSKNFTSGGSKIAPQPTDLKMVSFNINYGYQLLSGDTPANSTATEWIQMMNEHKKPDVLALQEFVPSLKKWMEDHYPFAHLINKINYRTAIYTDHPVIDFGFLAFENYENSVVWADIDFPVKGVCRIYNIHLQSNQITDQSELIKKEGLDWSWQSLRSVLEIFGNYQRSSAMRVNQVETILEHSKESPYPVIIMGDINDLPISYTYRKLSYGKKDSFLEAGRGFGVTYLGPVPLLRIDAIFTDPEFKTIDHQLIAEPFSDHKPVVAWVRKE